MTKQNLTRLSSPDEKKNISDLVYDKLMDYFFDKIVFISLIFSEALNTDGSAITSMSDYIGTSRITDTAEGRYMNVGKESRMRCSFYLENPDQLDGYILSPAVYDSFGSLNSISSMSLLRAYIGLKFVNGRTYVAAKEAGKVERLFPTSISFSGAGASATYELDIRHNIRFTDIYINSNLIGSYSSDLEGTGESTVTFLPLLSPARSSDGSAVGIVIENYQFVQNK